MAAIRKVEAQELPFVMKLIEKVVAWMQAGGSNQWSDTYPTAAFFENDIANSALFGLYEGKKLFGCMAVDQNRPEEYDSLCWSTTGQVFCIHRLALDPDFHGRGYGKMLLQYAENYVREGGGTAIQTDTAEGNAAMKRTFISCGFRAVEPPLQLRIAPETGFYRGFEKSVSLISANE